MKKALTVVTACALCSLALSSYAGSTMYWSANGTAAGAAGTWDGSTVNHWGATSTGPFTAAWVNANTDSASFGGTASYAMLYNGSITVNKISNTTTFQVTFSAGTGTPNLIFSGAGAGLDVASGGRCDLNGAYSGTMTKTGAGRLELNNSGFTGKFVFAGGFCSIAAVNRLGTVPGSYTSDLITFDGGGLGSSAASTSTSHTIASNQGISVKAGGAFFAGSAAVNIITVSSPIIDGSGGTGNGGITVTTGAPFVSPYNAGLILELNNTTATPNSYRGPTSVSSSSTLRLTANDQIPDGSVLTLNSGAVVDLNGKNDTVASLASAGGGATRLNGGTLTLASPAGENYGSGAINNGTTTGGKVVMTTGTWTTGSGSSDFNGGFTLNGGTLYIAGNAALGTGTLSVNGGTRIAAGSTSARVLTIPVDLAADVTFGDPAKTGTLGFGTGAWTLKSGNRQISVDTITMSITNVIGQDVAGRALTKAGAGTLRLWGANTFSGDTTVSVGTLEIGGSIASGNIYVSSGATLKLDTIATVVNTANFLLSAGTPTVNLNYSGICTINSMSLDGGSTYVPFGTWGSLTSTATHKDSRFTGNGILNITTGGLTSTVTGLTSSINPSTYGGAVLFTATVSGSGPTPTGTVTFLDGAATIGTGNLDAFGQATLNISTLTAAASPHSITATYNGDNVYNPATSSAYSQGVDKATLNVSANGTLVYGKDPTNAVYNAIYYTFQNGDTVSVLTGSPAFSTDAASTNYINSYVGTNYTVFVDVGTLAAGNYNIAAGTNGIMTIIPAPLNVTNVLGVDKIYDGTTNATVDASGAGLDGLVNGDDLFVTLGITGAVGNYTNKNVGVAKTVFVAGLFTIGELGTNYSLIQPITTASITQSNLTVTATAADKVYDGGTNTTASLSDNRVPGDVVNDTYTSAAFADKNVGPGVVTVSGISISGADAPNYNLVNTSASANANITQRSLTVTAAGVNRTYDGTTNASVNLSDNRVAGDVLTDSYTAAYFTDKTAAPAKPVSVTGISIGGADAPNYSLANNTAATTATISQADLTVTATGIDKPYDAGVTATVTLSDNKVAGDVVADHYASASFADPNVAAGISVSVSGISIDGADSGNYNLLNTSASTSANITAASSSTLLTSSLNPSTNGQSVTFTATVSSGAGTPTGDVVFLTNGVPMVTVALTGGTTNVATADLPVGTNAVSAQYAAQANWGASGFSLDQVVYSSVTLSATNALLSIVNNNDGTFTLNLLGTPGASYYIVSSGDISTPFASWPALDGSTNAAPGPDGAWSFMVSNAAPAFYRSIAINPAP